MEEDFGFVVDDDEIEIPTHEEMLEMESRFMDNEDSGRKRRFEFPSPPSEEDESMDEENRDPQVQVSSRRRREEAKRMKPFEEEAEDSGLDSALDEPGCDELDDNGEWWDNEDDEVYGAWPSSETKAPSEFHCTHTMLSGSTLMDYLNNSHVLGKKMGMHVFKVMQKNNVSKTKRGEKLKEYQNSRENEDNRCFNLMLGGGIRNPCWTKSSWKIFLQSRDIRTVSNVYKELYKDVDDIRDVIRIGNPYTSVQTKECFRLVLDIDLTWKLSTMRHKACTPGKGIVSFFVDTMSPCVMKLLPKDQVVSRVVGTLSSPRPNVKKSLKRMPVEELDMQNHVFESVEGKLKMGIHVCFSNIFVTYSVYKKIIEVLRCHDGIEKDYRDPRKNPMIGSMFENDPDRLPALKDILDKVSHARQRSLTDEKSGCQGSSIRDPFTVKFNPVSLHFNGLSENESKVTEIRRLYGDSFVQHRSGRETKQVICPDESKTNRIFFEMYAKSGAKLQRTGRSSTSESCMIKMGIVDPSCHLPVVVKVCRIDASGSFSSQDTTRSCLKGINFHNNDATWSQQVASYVGNEMGVEMSDYKKNVQDVILFTLLSCSIVVDPCTSGEKNSHMPSHVRCFDDSVFLEIRDEQEVESDELKNAMLNANENSDVVREDDNENDGKSKKGFSKTQFTRRLTCTDQHVVCLLTKHFLLYGASPTAQRLRIFSWFAEKYFCWSLKFLNSKTLNACIRHARNYEIEKINDVPIVHPPSARQLEDESMFEQYTHGIRQVIDQCSNSNCDLHAITIRLIDMQFRCNKEVFTEKLKTSFLLSAGVTSKEIVNRNVFVDEFLLFLELYVSERVKHMATTIDNNCSPRLPVSVLEEVWLGNKKWKKNISSEIRDTADTVTFSNTKYTSVFEGGNGSSHKEFWMEFRPLDGVFCECKLRRLWKEDKLRLDTQDDASHSNSSIVMKFVVVQKTEPTYRKEVWCRSSKCNNEKSIVHNVPHDEVGEFVCEIVPERDAEKYVGRQPKQVKPVLNRQPNATDVFGMKENEEKMMYKNLWKTRHEIWKGKASVMNMHSTTMEFVKKCSDESGLL